MTIRSPGATRIPPLEAVAHRFSVGQIVRMRSRSGVFPKTDEIFRITRTLPARDNLLQYRLRNDGENYERVATEDILEPVGAEAAADNAADPSPTKRSSAAAPAAPKGARPPARGKTRK